jgi:hypothetical protein
VSTAAGASAIIVGTIPVPRFFSNRPNHGDFTENFFRVHAGSTDHAQLACPFFTTAQPIELLRQADCSQIRLLVRLCEATSPQALLSARAMEGVQIRYFTASTFHAKFYILGRRALVGSANLTGGGLRQNRELSVEIGPEDELFDELPALFDELWNAAGVLTDDAMRRFEIWRRSNHPQEPTPIDGLPAVSPVTINVNTQRHDTVRTYLETFRRYYDERVLPAYRVVKRAYESRAQRHPDLEGYSLAYEIDRYFYWLKSKTTDDALPGIPLRTGDQLLRCIELNIAEWFGVHSPAGAFDDAERVGKLTRLREVFSSTEGIQRVDFDTLTDLLLACAAFHDRLRFSDGGLQGLVRTFKRRNSLARVQRTLGYLALGGGDYIQRIYDCAYGTDYKLIGWGENCTFELFGWINQDGIPPINGRVVKSLRYLGFNVLG